MWCSRSRVIFLRRGPPGPGVLCVDRPTAGRGDGRIRARSGPRRRRSGGPTPVRLRRIISLGALLYAATGLFNHLRYALNTIWHADPNAQSGIGGFVIGRLLSFLLVIGLGVALVIAVFASVAISSLRVLLNISSSFQVANILILLALIYVTIAMIYKVLPDVTIGWRYIWIGSAVTTALVSIGGVGVISSTCASAASGRPLKRPARWRSCSSASTISPRSSWPVRCLRGFLNLRVPKALRRDTRLCVSAGREEPHMPIEKRRTSSIIGSLNSQISPANPAA